MPNRPVFRGAFNSPLDGSSGSGKRPVIIDVLGPDWERSILPQDLRMVLHVNPSTMSIQHNRQVERIQTRGGFVEQHWGDSTSEISFEAATGGFMRLYAGLTSTTNPSQGGTRRETLAYTAYLELLALFEGNGAVYDANGHIGLQGILKITYDGGTYLGWFSQFTVQESAEKPYMFILSAEFIVHREIVTWRSTLSGPAGLARESTVEESSPPNDPRGRT